MDGNRHEQLVTYLHDRAGDYFRAAIRYDAESWELLYLRGDIEKTRLRETIARIHTDIMDRQAIVRGDEYPPLGTVEGGIELHENGSLLHIREEGEAGVIITLDRDAGRNLAGFIERCRFILEPPEASRYSTKRDFSHD